VCARFLTQSFMVFVVALLGCGPERGSASSGDTTSTGSTRGHEGEGRDVTSHGVSTESTAATTMTPPTSEESGAADTDSGVTTVQPTETGDEMVYECQVIECSGKVYECGDCIDNDGDGLVDSADPSCWGPCDNSEEAWKGNIPGTGGDPCVKVDCYFDHDKGSGNDDCHWALGCDPLLGCNPVSEIPGTDMTCEEASMMQSDQCAAYCGPLVPNGCDCFGCCEVLVGDDAHTVYIGTEAEFGDGTCGPATVDDPDLCKPCSQTSGCLNPCEPERCEICIGQTEPPSGCQQAGCPADVESCSPHNRSEDCPVGMACITGCCIPFPK
jgi:hypothetical protein